MADELTWYMCGHPGCPMGYPTQRQVVAHRKGHKAKETCPVCGKEIRRMAQHIRKVHGGESEPEVGEELSFETWEHWQEFEDTKTQLQESRALVEHLQAENARLDALRKRYYDNWQKSKRK